MFRKEYNCRTEYLHQSYTKSLTGDKSATELHFSNIYRTARLGDRNEAHHDTFALCSVFKNADHGLQLPTCPATSYNYSKTH